jgi:thiamine-monophosphate kinase
MGEVPTGRALLRSGARVGDDVLRVGRARGCGARRRGDSRPHDARRRRAGRGCGRSSRRRRRGSRSGIALRGVATAALDVSDGLVGDLSHILERSAVGAARGPAGRAAFARAGRLLGGAERALAIECLLAGGDDYELCFTAPREAAAAIAAIAERTGVPLTRIGTITVGPGLVVRDEQGVPLPALPRAYDHFG